MEVPVDNNAGVSTTTTLGMMEQNDLQEIQHSSSLNDESSEFSVEKIIDSVVTREGSRFYQVKWVDTWIDEASLLPKCQHLISTYWQQELSKEGADVINSMINTTGVSLNVNENLCDIDHNTINQIINEDNQDVVLTKTNALNESRPDITVTSSGNVGNEAIGILRDIIVTNKSTIIGEPRFKEEPKGQKNVVITTGGEAPLKLQQQQLNEAVVLEQIDLTPKVTHKCTDCGKFLSSKKVLRRHVVLKHLKNGRHQCPHCARRFFSSHELSRHMPVHTNVKAFTCETCGKSFKQAGHLLRHARVHDGQKPFQCNVCGNKFSQKENLINHLPTHGQEKHFKCSLCPSTFKHRNSVYTHMKRSHSAKRDSVCFVCDAGFQSKSLLRKHLQNAHSNALFKCPHCPRKYLIQKYLEKHIQKHNSSTIEKIDLKINTVQDNEESVFKCDLCTSTFKEKGHLSIHMNVHKSEKSNLLCEKCPTFKWPQNLARHLKTVHDACDHGEIMDKLQASNDGDNKSTCDNKDNRDIYACDLCDAKFTKKSYLVMHQQTHSTKRFECTLCEKYITNLLKSRSV